MDTTASATQMQRALRRGFVAGIACLLLLGTAGCEAGRGAGTPGLSPDVQDRTIAARTSIDSLFRGYDDALLQKHRPDAADVRRWADSVRATLSLDEKIGQLFIVSLPEPDVRGGVRDEAMRAVRAHGVGGFLVPRLLEPRRLFAQTTALQAASDVPLFFAADYERGAGRFSNALTELPSNMALGATRDTLLAAAAGRLTAIESRAVGVNLLFAPVVDVNNNPRNPIINIRSYGEEPELVGHMAAAFVREAQAYGLLTTLKHFPGHGNTSVDSHLRMGVVGGDRAALDRVELAPYRTVLESGARPAAVMSAHLWMRALDEAPLPATFSRNALSHLLRDALGFNGLVITDDVKMGGLREEYNLAERIVRPLQAGADVILTPEDLGAAIEAVKHALEDGRLAEADLDRSVQRILEAKARAGLHRQRQANKAVLDALLEEPLGASIAQTIADSAVTLLKAGEALPLEGGHEIALVQLSNYRNAESIEAAMDHLAEQLGAANTLSDARFDEAPGAGERDQTVRAAAQADVIVLALYLRLQAGRGEAGLLKEQADLARRLLEVGPPVVLVAFGNPYAASAFAGADALLVAYDQSIASVQAAAHILAGRQRPRGQLPIAVAPYPYGSGLGGGEETGDRGGEE